MKVEDPGLVGREQELSVLEGLLDDLTHGAGGALWLEGEPGIGKSALLDVLVERARTEQVTVLRDAAQELTEPFPLRVVAHCLGVRADAVDPVRAEIFGILSGDRLTGVLDPVLAASERMLELVDRLCATGPLLVVVEDLHWADRGSLAVWERWAQVVHQVPLLLVGSCHPVAFRPDIDRLRGAASVVLRPAPLDDAQVTALARDFSGGAVDSETLSGLAVAGGNPAYLRELLLVAPDPARLSRDDISPGHGGRSASLIATVGRRLDAFGAPTRGVLRMAALLGRQFEVRHLALLTGQPLSELVAALDEAGTAGILDQVGHRLGFRHELIRQVLRDETKPPVRAALHQHIARLLAESGAPVDAVAGHLLAGPAAIERWTVRWLADLPETALYAAPEVAAELLARAVRAPAASGQVWGVLAGRLAGVWFSLGRDAPAEELAAEVVTTVSEPDLLGRMQLCRVRVASRQARSEFALTLALASIDDQRLSSTWRTRIRARAAVVLLKTGRTGQAREQAQRALSEALHAGDLVTAGHARLVLAHLDAGDAALHQLRAALTGLGADPEAMELRMLLLNNLLAQLNNLGLPEEFHTTANEALITAARAGVSATGKLISAVAMGAFDFGAWDEALLHLEPLGPLQPGDVHMSRIGVTALIAGHREQWALLREQVGEGELIPITSGDVRILSGYLVAARALRSEADGHPEQAVRELSYWLDPTLGFDAKERFMWLPDLTRLALAVDDLDTAQAAVAAAQADAAGADALLRQVAAADLCQAQLADDVVTLQRVADLAERHGWVLMRACALEEAAVRLAGAGEATQARAVHSGAARAYAGLGAGWDLRRIDARMRSHGIRRGPRSLQRRPATGWAALTPTEQRIATLVAQGRSNPDIAAELYLSRRTVQTHVSRILHKLDVRSRLDVVPPPDHL